ncbi:hypothetical protein PsYK624_142990 [Phanerochaete sordida]|uniref:F-box domain-containing protein n=1 Tax=Phanerochaete sordida TaxID=48140 RepID=A0A9P3GME0_9APHY|nr:hypothetical protein PsYK624_142990 [Phanerochaete sordida]
MHSALLIDEVLQVILEHCADWSAPQYRQTLAQLAQCCKAFKDPALDRLWKKLDGIGPLERLDDEKSASEFDLYAARVKSITFNRTPNLPEFSERYSPLPNLKSVVLRDQGCLIPSSYLSTPLEDVEVDLRRARTGRSVSPISTADRLTAILQDNVYLRRSLQSLRIKGLVSTALSDIIPSFQSLRSLVLQTGNTLSASTLAALGTLSCLQDVYVHASHVDSGDFSEAISQQVSQPFASLRSLRIRAQRSLFRAMLDVLPCGTLTSLYLETEESAQGPSAWEPTFALIAAKAGGSLAALTLDQILDPEELPADSAPPDARFALDTLQPLRSLRALRRLTIDAMLLPDFTDRDVDTLARWWPRLEHLDLGAVPDVQEYAESWAPRVTLAALRSLAKRCPGLRSLTLPLDAARCAGAPAPDDAAHDGGEPVRQRALQRLLVGASPADEDVAAFVRAVVAIFPGVREIECASASAERALSLEVQSVVKAHADGPERRRGTSDGFADGQ